MCRWCCFIAVYTNEWSQKERNGGTQEIGYGRKYIKRDKWAVENEKWESEGVPLSLRVEPENRKCVAGGSVWGVRRKLKKQAQRWRKTKGERDEVRAIWQQECSWPQTDVPVFQAHLSGVGAADRGQVKEKRWEEQQRWSELKGWCRAEARCRRWRTDGWFLWRWSVGQD